MPTTALTRTRRDPTLWAKAINDQWGGARPILSPEASLVAARKLYRHATGKAWKGKWKLTSGIRRTFPVGSTYYVNPDERGERGLREIIHEISHYTHWRMYPKDKPHSIRQIRLEAKLTKFAVSRGWHESPPPVAEKVPTSKPDAVVLRYRRMVVRRDKWIKEAERSARLAKKAATEVRAYERRHGERLQK